MFQFSAARICGTYMSQLELHCLSYLSVLMRPSISQNMHRLRVNSTHTKQQFTGIVTMLMVSMLCLSLSVTWEIISSSGSVFSGLSRASNNVAMGVICWRSWTKYYLPANLEWNLPKVSSTCCTVWFLCLLSPFFLADQTIEPQIKRRRLATANQPSKRQSKQIEQSQSVNNQVQQTSGPTQMQTNSTNSFFAQYPIRDAFQFARPCAQALHGLPYTTVANTFIGNHTPNPSISVSGKPQYRGKDKIPGARKPRKRCCMFCLKNGNEQWLFLCRGRTPRGKCEYFDSDGNMIKPVDQPPEPRGNARNK